MSQEEHQVIDNNEDNILKAFEMGAGDLLNQKRDPKDFIVFENTQQAPTQKPQLQNYNNKNNSSKYGDQQQSSATQDKLVIGFEEDDDDDDFTGNQQHSNQKQIAQSSNHNSNKQVFNQKNNYNQNNVQEDDSDGFGDDNNKKNDFEVDKNNKIDNQMFINRNDLDNNNYQGGGKAISKPAGIYLEKDEDLDKLKEIYEGGQEKEKVEAANKQFAMNRQAQEKKKKQFNDQKKQKDDKENNSDIAKLTKNDFKYDKKNKIKNLINDEEELGEIGEWIEKTANVNRKKKDDGFDNDEDDDDEQNSKNNDDDDFDFDIVPENKNNQKENNDKKANNGGVIAEEGEDDDENEESWDGKQNKGNKLSHRNNNNGNNVNNIISQEVQLQKKKEEQEMLRQKQEIINKKLQQQQILKHKSGPIANRLQDKAKFMELTNVNKETTDNNKGETANKQGSENVIQIIKSGNEIQKNNEQGEEEDDDEGVNWEQINQHAIKQHQLAEGQGGNKGNKVIGFIDAWSNLKGQNLQELKKDIVRNNNEKKNTSLFEYLNSFCGVITPNISSVELLHERDQLLAIAKMQYSDNDSLHFEMLYSIFTSLTSNFNCPRLGTHWEQIGFQGKLPATDLRSTGILGLLQILAFVSHYKEFLIDALEYSHNSMHNFPLCLTLINVTDIVLQASREQKLNGLINKEKSVVSVFNNVYFAAFYLLYTEYKQKQMTLNMFGELRKSVETIVKQNPKKVVEDFKVAIQQYYKHRE